MLNSKASIFCEIAPTDRVIDQSDKSLDGSNVGINMGATAGQSVFHVHVQLISRRIGDVENPKDRVRGVIPSKQKY